MSETPLIQVLAEQFKNLKETMLAGFSRMETQLDEFKKDELKPLIERVEKIEKKIIWVAGVCAASWVLVPVIIKLFFNK